MDDAVLLPRHKLDVEAYHRMGQAGILGEDDRIELIDGALIDMAPIAAEHAATVNALAQTLMMACGDRAIVSVQNPVRLDSLNESQPDLMVLRPRADRYRAGHPGPADVLLLIEVADSSLRLDRQVKLPLYAQAGIAELWIVDLGSRRVDVFRDPAGPGYATTQTYRSGDRVVLGQTPGISVALDRVFD